MPAETNTEEARPFRHLQLFCPRASTPRLRPKLHTFEALVQVYHLNLSVLTEAGPTNLRHVYKGRGERWSSCTTKRLCPWHCARGRSQSSLKTTILEERSALHIACSWKAPRKEPCIMPHGNQIRRPSRSGFKKQLIFQRSCSDVSWCCRCRGKEGAGLHVVAVPRWLGSCSLAPTSWFSTRQTHADKGNSPKHSSWPMSSDDPEAIVLA